MRLMIMRMSSSLYLKGLIATGEKDQELGPWFTASGLGGTVVAKRRLFHEKIKNSTKPQTLRRATTANYRASDITPLDVPPNGL